MKERKSVDKILQQIIYRLPGRVLYWSIVAAFARATTGKWSGVNCSKVTIKDLMDRL